MSLEEFSKEAREQFSKNFQEAWKEVQKCWLPPPDLTVSEWAEQYRWLSPESNIGRVKWKNETMPHLVEPMDALSSNSPYREVVCMFPSQDGKTEIGLNWAGYIMKCDPGPILVIQPNEKPMGEAWSKERFAPMVRDTPELEGIVGAVNARTGTTVMHKQFSGGHLSVVGANSPAGLAARPVRYRHLDETARWPLSAGKEGSPEALSKKRLRRFEIMGIDKSLITSSPTFEDMNVDASYKKCDVQKEWQIACLKCGAYQYPKREVHILWTDDDPKTTHFKCEKCGHEHHRDEELKVKETGKWITVADSGGMRSIGFHKSLYTSPHMVWANQIQQWLQCADDPEAQQVYVNTEEGENWELKGETLDEYGLMNRRENYEYQVPKDVHIITQAVDVQKNRWEIDRMGWGPGNESWLISHEVIYGDPSQESEWTRLVDHLFKPSSSPYGNMTPMWTFIDSGYLTDEVYAFCYKYRASKVFACKGSSEMRRPLVTAPTKTKLKDNRREINLYNLGVHEGKHLVFHRLSIEEPAAGYIHFPLDVDRKYFEGLTSEHIVTRQRAGQRVKVFELRPGKTKRNEPLDMMVYNSAAIKMVNPVWDALVKRRAAAEEPEVSNTEDEPKPTFRRRRARPKRNFVRDY